MAGRCRRCPDSRRGAGARFGCCATYWETVARPSVRTVAWWICRKPIAVHDVLADVLQPRRLATALDRLFSNAPTATTSETLMRQFQRVEGELTNLSDTSARGGAVPAILDALAGGTRNDAGFWRTWRPSRTVPD